MTDVEPKTPSKRKSFSNAENKKGSVKKVKLENTKSPQKNFSKKFDKKNKSGPENDTPKKMKPFAGTRALDIKIKNEKSPKQTIKTEDILEKKKKKRSNQFQTLELKIKSNKDEALEKIEGKIKDIQSRNELTKTAKRKLKHLQRLKKIANGEPVEPPQQQKAPHSKSESTKRRERKKNAQKASGEIVQQSDIKANGKTTKKVQNKKVAPKQVEDDNDSEEVDEPEEEESDDEELSNAEGESDDEESGEEEQDDEEAEEEEDSDESEEESSPPPKIKNPSSSTIKTPNRKQNLSKTDSNNRNMAKEDTSPDLVQLKKNNLLNNNQKRYVLFVGNIPYDTNKLDLIEHFKKSGEIKHIRIPTEKKSSKPRGFAYVEVANEESYQKCLSLHHTFLKNRRINVLYTQGGKKKGDEQKKEIKAKNFKLHAMRKQGQLAGSKKETNKRSFRRSKKKASETQEQQE